MQIKNEKQTINHQGKTEQSKRNIERHLAVSKQGNVLET